MVRDTVSLITPGTNYSAPETIGDFPSPEGAALWRELTGRHAPSPLMRAEARAYGGEDMWRLLHPDDNSPQW